MNRRLALLLLSVIMWRSAAECPAADWPMWRCTPERSAAVSAPLPAELRVLWRRTAASRTQTWDDPLNLDLMTYDRVFEPIVMDGRLFVGFNDQDKLVAYSADTGEELWSFYTEGPVRLPPAGSKGLVYFCSDDGFLYCVKAEDGQLEWRFRGAPSAQHALGNERLTSAWPARGGPVIRDDRVYFAASIWPFMGTFLYALDARTGEVQWVNDSTGSQFIRQPHSAPSFAGVAPQGALVATEESLVVPGGRSVPAVFNRHDGSLRYFEINAGGKGTGGSFVAATDESFFVHTRLKGTREFDLETGLKTAFTPNEPVLHEGLVYSAETHEGQSVVRAYGPEEEVVWQIAADGRGDLILAGEHLYAAGATGISAIRLPAGEREAEVTWSLPVDGQVERLLAADDKLFAVTLEGDLLALGAGDPVATAPLREVPQPLDVTEIEQEAAAALLSSAESVGYAFWFGGADEPLVEAVAAVSPFIQLAVVDADEGHVDRLRLRLDAAGQLGRVTVHHSSAEAFLPPKYVANLVVVGSDLSDTADESQVRSFYEAVRPYGGVLHLLSNGDRDALAERVTAMSLEQAEVEVTALGVLVRRVGALPGSADWTHQHGDIANTRKSNDARVKLPLGILWFGGSSNLDVLPRHGHGPPEQVVGGRLFVQGMNSLSARDVYTGRVLWKREFADLGTFDVYYDATYEDTPLDPKYNQVHIPGANGRGTNYVVTDDRVYIVEGSVCHVLDPATGELLQDISLGKDAAGRPEEWGFLGVYEDVLIGGVDFAMYRARHDVTVDSDKDLRDSKAGFGSKSFDRAASLGLVGFDRHTGERLWKVEARHSFWHNGIVAGGGRIYCLDRNPTQIEEVLKRRGRGRPESYRILAFDAHSGNPLWESTEEVFGTWLGYSAAQDLLLQAGAAASDRLSAEVGTGMAVHSAADGSLRWKKASLQYSGPCILHNDLIITNANSYAESAGAFRLSDGEQKLVSNPLTGELQPWKLTRAYGCNTVIASENLLTFRSGAAGFYDLLNDSGTGNFGGFKSGCTANLVVANGVLNAPDYTRTCSCGYQNQTSLALVHMPEVEVWSIHGGATVDASGQTIRRLGLNLGAPGDRRDENGLLWLEYPVVAGPSPPLKVEFNAEAVPFQQHSSKLSAAESPWIFASGLAGITDLKIGMRLESDDSLASGIPVDHADDDAEEDAAGTVDLGSSDLELVDDGGPQVVGVRINDLQLQRGTVIRSASLQFVCDEASTDETSLQISVQAAGHAARFSGARHDLSARPTTSPVGWVPPPWPSVGEAGAAQRTPDLAALVQTVIDRPDWQPGNSLAFLIRGDGKRVAKAYADGPARLIIDADEVADQASAQTPAGTYRVRLFFATPPSSAGTQPSVFDVHLQGQPVLKQVTLDPAGPAAGRVTVETIDEVMIADELHLRIVPHQGIPCLSGIEVISRETP